MATHLTIITSAQAGPDCVIPADKLHNPRNDWDKNAALAALVGMLHEEYGGSWEQGRRWLVSAAEQFWPKTVKDRAREFWRYAPSVDTGRLIELFQASSDDFKTTVLAEADATIECHDAPWSSPLTNDRNRTYRYHLAVAVPMALAHPIFQHISLESIEPFMAHRAFGCRDSRGCPCQSFEHVVETLARNFGLTCSECRKTLDCSDYESLGVSEHGYDDLSLRHDGSHKWSSGLCPTCWEWKRTLALSKRPGIAKIAKLAREVGCEITKIDVSTGLVRVGVRSLRPSKRRKQKYSRKVMEWKAAHDALRELGVIAEDMHDEFYRGTEGGDTCSHTANVEGQIDTRPFSRVDKN